MILAPRRAATRSGDGAKDFPARPDVHSDLAVVNLNLGTLLQGAGRAIDAESAYRAAIAVQSRLVEDYPTNPYFRDVLAGIHHSLGDLLQGAGRDGEAEAAFRVALTIRTKLVKDFPKVAYYKNDLVGSFVSSALLCRKRNELADARRLLAEALPHHQAVLSADPLNPTYRRYFRNNTRTLARALADLGDHAAATAKADELAAFALQPQSDFYDAARILARCVPLAAKDAHLTDARRQALTKEYIDRAMTRLREAAAAGFTNTARMLKDSDLDVLRRRADYAELLWDLADGLPPAGKPGGLKP